MKKKQNKYQSSSSSSNSSQSSSSSLLSKKKIIKKQPIIQKEEVSFIPSGILAKFTNNQKYYKNNQSGVTLKYNQPSDAIIPPKDIIYKLFIFKDNKDIGTIDLINKSSFLIGKEEISDIHLDNPSISKQHAVIQFRKPNTHKIIKVYLIDLETTNGTFLNGKKIEPAHYIELLQNDVLKFGMSTREYVFMSQHIKLN